MVENITNYVCRGVAGRRSGAIQGLVYHNDAGSIYATAKHYVEALSRMSNKQLKNGFAHGYIDYLTNARTENLLNMAWHTANTRGNAYFIGLEACQSMGSSVEQFLKNEQEMFKQGAAILKANGLPVNESTIMLHMEFSATACPHRSWELHGRSIKSVKAYFIQQTKLYYDGKNGNSSTVKPDTSKPTPTQPSTIKIGSIVKVKQAVNYDNGKSFKTYYDKYTVLNLDNNRAVIGVSGNVTSAIHIKNLELVSNANTGAANPSPTKPVTTNWKRVAETGTFICGKAVPVKNEPTVKSTQVALYEKGGAVNYDSYVVNDGHVWISYIAGSGTRRYMAIRKTGREAWGNFI